MNIRHLLQGLLCFLLPLDGCAVKDGQMRPADGIIKIVEGENVIDANNYTLQIAPMSETYIVLEYWGEEDHRTLSVFSKTGEPEKNGISWEILKDIKVVSPPNKWGSCRVHQTLKITTAEAKIRGSRRFSLYIACKDGAAKLNVLLKEP